MIKVLALSFSVTGAVSLNLAKDKEFVDFLAYYMYLLEMFSQNYEKQ